MRVSCLKKVSISVFHPLFTGLRFISAPDVSVELSRTASSPVLGLSAHADVAKCSSASVDAHQSRHRRPDPLYGLRLALRLPDIGRAEPAEVYVHPSLTVGGFRHRVTEVLEDGDRILSCSVESVRTLDGLAVGDEVRH